MQFSKWTDTIDVVIAKKSSFDQMRFDRSVRIPIADDCLAVFSSPEDIILKKMEWHEMGGGDRHLRDIAGILKIRGDSLDREYISTYAQELGLSDLWQAVQAAVNKS